MQKTRSCVAAVLLLSVGVFSAGSLRGQSAQVRAKVSASLPKYQPKVQVKGVIELSGSDALQDLGDEWTRGFKRFHPESRMVFFGKLSKDMAKGLVDGAIPMAILARELSVEETKAFQSKFGYMPMRIPVCLDANVVFVHKDNPMTSITMEQLDAIYSKTRLGGAKSEATTWGDLKVKGDLAKRAIHAYTREEGTSTRQALASMAMLKGQFRAGIIDKTDYTSLAEAILTDPAGIAVGPLASWYTANKVLPVVPHQGTDARFPNQENIESSRYPMARLYYAYINRAPGKDLDPGVNELLHYILANEGQAMVADVGLIPGPVEFLSIGLKRLNR